MLTLDKTKLKYLLVISIAGGILSGVLSLTISSLVPKQLHEMTTFFAILLFVLIEESSKIIAIWSILRSFSLFKIISPTQTIFLATLVGFGFGLFEFFLILLGSQISINALNPMMVHLGTAIFQGIAFAFIIKNNVFSASFFFILSLAFHLCYNMFVVLKLI